MKLVLRYIRDGNNVFIPEALHLRRCGRPTGEKRTQSYAEKRSHRIRPRRYGSRKLIRNRVHELTVEHASTNLTDGKTRAHINCCYPPKRIANRLGFQL